MHEKKRLIVTGATGLLGRELLQTFKKSFLINVQGWGFSRADGKDVLRVDITSNEDVTRALESFSPHVVIHAAAERRPDVVEKDPEAARKLNVGATRFLAQECARRKVKMIYISTDYVFDGTSPPYSESSLPNPLNSYGELKLAGEEATRAAAENHAVLRIPILFGQVEKLEESAVTVLLKALLDPSKPCKMDNVQLRYPIHAKHVASALDRFLGHYFMAVDVHSFFVNSDGSRKEGEPVGEAPNDFRGIFHISGLQCVTKYEMADMMAEALGIDASHMTPDASTAGASAAKRPHHVQLSCERLEELRVVTPFNHRTDFKEDIEGAVRGFVEKRH